MRTAQHNTLSVNQVPGSLGHLSEEAERGGNALSVYFQSTLGWAAGVKYSGSAIHHPILALNAIKNLIGDDRDRPSRALLEAASDCISHRPFRTEDEDIIKQVQGKDLGQTIFVKDLEDVYQEGDPEAIDRESARLYLASDRSPAVLERLAVLSLWNFDAFGSFIYHLLRASAFQQSGEYIWTFIRCMLTQRSQTDLSSPHCESTLTPGAQITQVLGKNDPELWVNYTSAWRLWDLDLVHKSGVQREISSWLAGLKFTEQDPGVAPESGGWLKEYLQDPEHQFIHRAEWILQGIHEWNMDVAFRLVTLESLRYLARKVSREHLPLVAIRIEETVEAQ